MKTDRERVDEITASLFAAYLKDRYKMALGGKPEAEILRKARSDAWKIVRTPTPGAELPPPLEIWARMEDTRMYPRNKDRRWMLIDLNGDVRLECPDGTLHRPEDRLPPEGVEAKEFVRYYRTTFKNALANRFLGESVVADAELGAKKPEIWCDGRRVCPECEIKMAHVGLGVWRCEGCGHTSLTKPELGASPTRDAEVRRQAFWEIVEMLRSLAGVYAKADPIVGSKHLVSGIFHAAARVEAMMNNLFPNDAKGEPVAGEEARKWVDKVTAPAFPSSSASTAEKTE
jgi:ribosomal protein L37AE/L43A